MVCPPDPRKAGASDYWCRDPREGDESFVPDSSAWEALLLLAWLNGGRESVSLFGSLRALRCEGARLVSEGESLRIVPPAGMSETAMWSEWLAPWASAAAKMLEHVADQRCHGLAPAQVHAGAAGGVSDHGR